MLVPDRSKRVVVVGDVGVDIIVHFPEFLDSERKKVAFRAPKLVGGGTCGNTAVALSKLGVSPYVIGTVGDDTYGKFVLEDLEKERVRTQYIKVDPEVNTVGVFAFIDEYGERYLWGWPRVDRCFEKLELTEQDTALLDSADWIHSSGMVTVNDTSSRAAVEQIFAYAHKKGIPTSYDLNLRVNNGSLDESFRASTLRILENCTYVLGSSEEELYYLDCSRDWRDTAKSLVSPQRSVVARMGAQGSMFFTQKGVYQSLAYPVEVVDTVGAGDVYNGAFIAAVLAGYEGQEILEYCNAASGYSVAREGARSSPCTQELEDFMRQVKR